MLLPMAGFGQMQPSGPAGPIALYFDNWRMIHERLSLDFLPSPFRQGEQYE
jgi:hypothetical protein